MYKDKEKQKATGKERQRRYRKGVTGDLGVTETEGVTPSKSQVKRIATQIGQIIKGVTDYPDIIDKLTDPVWRPKLEKICHAFKSSSNPPYSKDVWLGDTNLSVVCDWLECTG